MKLIILSNHVLSVPVLDYFSVQGWLKAVVSTNRLRGQHLGLEEFCNQRNILHLKVNKKGLLVAVNELFTAVKPDVVIMFSFSYRIPKVLYDFPTLGFFNVHFSLLPAYKGPDPLFRQMVDRKTSGGVSIHKVDDNFDTGSVVLQQVVPFIPGETWGIADGRHSAVAVNMMVQLVEQLRATGGIAELPVDAHAASYFPRATTYELAINWALQTAEEIEALVNACNPGAGGALTTFKQQMVKVLEVSPVDAQGDPGVEAGTVVHADASGIYVQCVDDKILRVNIIKLNEGYITGSKLAAMGVQRGEKFENGLFEYQETN
ncbi:methionyl-tRNA formyltransferase [Pedobacter sp. GSP4]|uniref:methionyl-tRNA formyltransferase n=1 Tax=Pedobacter sp. GSP4 TaxID=3453716 RepID=UPI003EE8A9E9